MKSARNPIPETAAEAANDKRPTRSHLSYAKKQRLSDDPLMSVMPPVAAHDPLLAQLFARLAEFRRATEDVTMADADLEDGKISPSAFSRATQRYERIRRDFLRADEAYRVASAPESA